MVRSSCRRTKVAKGASLTVPVLVETPFFRSELVLSNSSPSTATLQMRYVESNTPSLGAGGTTTIELPAGRQLIVPDAVDFLRGRSVAIGPKDQTSYVGSLRITVSGVPRARSSRQRARVRGRPREDSSGSSHRPSPRTGQRDGQGVASRASRRRPEPLERRCRERRPRRGRQRDAFAPGSGRERRRSSSRRAGGCDARPGAWKQWGRFLDAKGVRNGWVEVTRIAGTAPWIAYGVINDGAFPGDRTGDGAYVPMVIDGERTGGDMS